MSINEEALLVLLNASAKETVDDILMTCFRFRLDTIPERKNREWRTELGISAEQIAAMTPSVSNLIDQCLLQGKLPAQVLSPSFHPQLASLLGKLIKSRAEDWKATIIQNQVSPARLVDFDFRIDNTISTDQMTNVHASSLLLNLHVQDPPTHKDQMPSTRTVQLELTTQELNTLLDGMLKIKDSLP